MNREEVFEKVVEICRDVFDDEELVLNETSSSKDVEAWDSLTHLTLINEIEEAFDIAFSLEEISKSKNLGELMNALMRHIEEN